ncbi:Ribosome-recycling factor [Candidatus Xenohaliotis californiensis]|uniref:Ribosome-recycling factor n=1 Tax=Candidatus Xenohaliotis californiensis TaxID=84677 RepID=A0ABM9N8B8_9RICK|nr:Ribosome-recycling factor [Candidatus Xenohaliotis californiensis]
MEILDIIPLLKKALEVSIVNYKKEIAGIRTGYVTISLLDSVMVKVYGNNMPITQVASVSVQDSRVLVVQVWDLDNVDAVQKAILASDLGLAPIIEGNVLRINVPPLNHERRQEMVRAVAKCTERCRIALRSIRRNHVDMLKNIDSVSKDALHKTTTEIDSVVAKYNKDVDSIFAKKEAEIIVIK